MSDVRQPWFKIWASEALLSDDLDDLSDHDERIWWRLVMVASLEEERWTAQLSEKTARKCHTKLPKLRAAVENFCGRVMLDDLGDGWFFVTNGPKWNEDTERRRKPSDSKDRILDRVHRHRNAKRNAALQDDCNDAGNAAHKEEEKEEEQSRSDLRARPARNRKLIPLTEEERAKLLRDFPGSEEQIALALAHDAHLKYPTGQYLYVRNWLRNDRSRVAEPRRIEFSNDLPKPDGITVTDMGFRE